MSDLIAFTSGADFWAKAAIFAVLLVCLSFAFYVFIAGIDGGNPLELPIAAVAFVAHLCVVVAIVVALYARVFAEVAYLPFHLWRQRRRRLRDSHPEIPSADIVAVLRKRGAA